MLLGYSKTRALMALYGACLMLSLAGLSILLFRGMILPVALAVFCLGALGLARYLGYVRRWGSLREQWRHALARRRKLEHWRAHALALEFDIERCVDLAQFLTVLRLSDGREACFASVDDDSSQAWLQRRALDAFVDPLELALQRWNALPPCVAKPVNEAPP
jgi:UDP-GlcNAc:undecaprenyl-phosphate GlcNAc-1-phosphate transferase